MVQPVTSQPLGPGRISELEQGSVVNVQGPTLPSSNYPNSNLSANPTLPAPATLPRVGDQAGTGGNSVTPPPAFGAAGQSSRSGTSGSLSDLLVRPPNSSGASNQISTPTLPANSNSTGGPSSYSSPAGDYANRSQPPNGFGAVTPGEPGSRGATGLPANPGMGTFPSRTPASLTADGNFSGLPPTVGNDARSPVPNFGSAPGAGDRPVFDRDPQNTAGNYQPPGYPNENFNRGDYARNAPTNPDYPNRGNGLANNAGMSNGYGPPGYGQGNFGRDPNGSPNQSAQPLNPSGSQLGPPPYQGARNPEASGGFVDTRSASDRGLAADATSKIRGGNPQDRDADTNGGSYDGSNNAASNAAAVANMNAGNVLVQMFFLVSLVANVYLVFLIRKLLSRYRSLLATVRSHAA